MLHFASESRLMFLSGLFTGLIPLKDGERTRPSSDCHSVQGGSLLCFGHWGVGSSFAGTWGPRQKCGGAVGGRGLQKGQELPAWFHASLHVPKGKPHHSTIFLRHACHLTLRMHLQAPTWQAYPKGPTSCWRVVKQWGHNRRAWLVPALVLKMRLLAKSQKFIDGMQKVIPLGCPSLL